MKNTNALKNNVKNLTEERNIGANVFVVIKLANKKYQIEKLDIDNQYQDALLVQFKKLLIEKISDNISLEVIKISQYEKKDHKIIYEFDLMDKPEYVKTIMAFNPFNVKTSFNISDINNIHGFVVVIGNDQNYLKIYQHRFNSNIIGRKTRMCITKYEDRFILLTNDVISLESRIDLLICGESVYIDNISMLEKNFGFHDLINKEAISLIENKISTANLLDSLDKLKEFVGKSTAFARRLLRVIPISPILANNISLITIDEALKNYSNELHNNLKYKKDKSKIIVKTKKEADFFVDVLEDKFPIPIISKLHSEKQLQKVIG